MEKKKTKKQLTIPSVEKETEQSEHSCIADGTACGTPL